MFAVDEVLGIKKPVKLAAKQEKPNQLEKKPLPNLAEKKHVKTTSLDKGLEAISKSKSMTK